MGAPARGKQSCLSSSRVLVACQTATARTAESRPYEYLKIYVFICFMSKSVNIVKGKNLAP